MLYYYPAEWTLDGKGTNVNNELSEGDQQFIAQLYGAAIKEKTIPFAFSGHDWAKAFVGGDEPVKKHFNAPNGRILDVTVHITKRERASVRSVRLENGWVKFDGTIEKGAFFQYGKLSGYINIKYVPFVANSFLQGE